MNILNEYRKTDSALLWCSLTKRELRQSLVLYLPYLLLRSFLFPLSLPLASGGLSLISMAGSVLLLGIGVGLQLWDSPYAAYVWRFWLCWGCLSALLRLLLWGGMSYGLYRRRCTLFTPAAAETPQTPRLTEGEEREVSWQQGDGFLQAEVCLSLPEDGYYLCELTIEDIHSAGAPCHPQWELGEQEGPLPFEEASVEAELRGVFRLFLKAAQGNHCLRFRLRLPAAQPATLRLLTRPTIGKGGEL